MAAFGAQWKLGVELSCSLIEPRRIAPGLGGVSDRAGWEIAKMATLSAGAESVGPLMDRTSENWLRGRETTESSSGVLRSEAQLRESEKYLATSSIPIVMATSIDPCHRQSQGRPLSALACPFQPEVKDWFPARCGHSGSASEQAHHAPKRPSPHWKSPRAIKVWAYRRD